MSHNGDTLSCGLKNDSDYLIFKDISSPTS